jgi:hypothetical protein
MAEGSAECASIDAAEDQGEEGEVFHFIAPYRVVQLTEGARVRVTDCVCAGPWHGEHGTVVWASCGFGNERIYDIKFDREELRNATFAATQVEAIR